MEKGQKTIMAEAISAQKQKIVKEQELLAVLNGLDISSPISEEMWHDVCQTSLRNSPELLGALLLAIFPTAKNIKYGPNDMRFEIDSFSLKLPTSFGHSISCHVMESDSREGSFIDYSGAWCEPPSMYCGFEEYSAWYKKHKYSYIEKFVERYIDLLKNNASWYTLVNARYSGREIRKNFKPIYLTWLWFFEYKPSDKRLNRDLEFYEKECASNNRHLLSVYISRAERYNQKMLHWKHFFNVVQPVLLKFTNQISFVNGCSSTGAFDGEFNSKMQARIAEYDEKSEAFTKYLQEFKKDNEQALLQYEKER